MRRARINPMSDKRRAKLAAAGNPFPVSTLIGTVQPAPKMRARPSTTGPDQAMVELVLARDNWSCCVCGDGLVGRRGYEWSIHHRLRRSQGVDNRPSVLVATCGHGTSQCHGDIHGAPAKALQGGWLIRSTEVAELVPMAHSQYGWVLLDNEGGWVETDPPSDPMVAALPSGGEPF